MEAVTERGPLAAESVLGGVGSGLRDSVLNAETRARIEELIDSVMVRLEGRLVSLRDTTLGADLRELVSGIMYAAAGDTTRLHLANLRDELIGDETLRLVARLRTELLGDSTASGIGLLRDELLGPKTQAAVRAIVDSAMAGIVRSYRDDLQPGLRADVGFIQKNATTILLVGGGIVIAIIYIVWHQKRKFQRTANLLTYQIHEIPDRHAYDELTARIRRKAQETGIEPDLRKILKEQGILGSEAWTPPRSTT